MRRLLFLVSLLLGLTGVPALAGDGPKPTCLSDCITELALPPDPVGPFGIAEGPDHAIWFSHGNAVARLGRDGGLTRYVVPTTNPLVGWVIAGPHRTVWFAERFGNKIGRLDVDTGAITEYAIPTAVPCSGVLTSLPQGIAVGRDHRIWFTEECGNKIGRLERDGTITEFTVPTPDSHPLGIVAGPDGALWFVERAGKIGRITTEGEITEYALDPASFPQRITVGHDGALWFTELTANKIGRITTDGELSEYPLPPGRGPVGITAGRDKALWIVEFGANKIGRMSTDGVLTHEYDIPTPNSRSLQIAAGHDWALWFTETRATNRIGRLQPFPQHDNGNNHAFGG